MKSIRSTANSLFAAFAIAILFSLAASAQPPAQPDMPVDAATRSAVIDTLLKQLNDAYVFPEVAKKMEADIRSRIAAKEYDSVDSSTAFAQKLTADLQSVSKDKHLRVRYSSRPIPVRTGGGSGPTPEQRAEFERNVKFDNFGFERVERQRGNIGYVDLLGFFAPELGAETVRSVFSFLANTDALIIDLRRNGGGDPEMVARISSYLFADRVLLNTMYWRNTGKTDEFWTDPKVVGPKFADKPVYVLTSARSFSGAEEFAYNLKNLKRATIVGETTGGGAHPGGPHRLSDHFTVFVPIGRAINPISKTNWEGTGVEPDVKVPKEQALHTAQLLALQALLKDAKDDDRKAMLNRTIAAVQGELDQMKAAGAKTAAK